MSESTQPTTQLTDRLQKLERKISTRVEDVVRGLHEQIGERMRQASDDVLRWIDEHASELPSSFLEADDLADVAAEVTAEHRAIDQALDAMRRIDGETTQIAILTALVEEARRFASRTAFFLLRDGHARAWASRGFGERDSLAGVELPGDGPWASLGHGVVVLGEAARQELARRLDLAAADAAVLVPFVVRGAVAGALYAERSSDEDAPLGVKGLQLATYAATQALETSAVSPGTSPALLMAGATAPADASSSAAALSAAAAVAAAAAATAPAAAQHEAEDVADEAHEVAAPAPDVSAEAIPGEVAAGEVAAGDAEADEILAAATADPVIEDSATDDGLGAVAEPAAEPAAEPVAEPLLEAPTDHSPDEVVAADVSDAGVPADAFSAEEASADDVFEVEAEPSFEEPTFEEPALEEPALEEPSFEAQPADEPAFEADTFDEAPALEPVADAALDDADTPFELEDASAEAPEVKEEFDGDATSPALGLEEPTVEVPEPAAEVAAADDFPEDEASPWDPLGDPQDLAAAAPPAVPDLEIDDAEESEDDFAYDSDAAPPSFDEIAEEQVPEPELEDTNIWELEDDEPDPARSTADFDPQVGQRTVRLDVAQIQEQARQGDLAEAAPGSPDSIDLDSEEPTLISTPAPAVPPPAASEPVAAPEPLPAPEPPVAPEPPAPEPSAPSPTSYPSSFAEPPPPVAPSPPVAEPAPPPPQPTDSTGSTEVKPPDDLQGPGLAFAASQPAAAAARSEGEDALHDEARRLARLLVSEIKLYNEEVIEEGRRTGNIYERLKDDIDRSRQMYEERIDPRLSDQEDYFYQELVQRLAGGDEKLLGM